MADPTQTTACWVVNDDPETGRPLEVALANDPDIRVCFLASDGRRSTARLIAAAPDLLRALIALLPDGWGDNDSMDHMPGVKQARAAIAKAEGAKNVR